MAEEDPWELYYWPGLAGRGDAAGVPWIEKNLEKGKDTVLDFVYKGGNTGFPVFAVPVIKKGSFVLSQTPAILAYLGRKFGLAPASEETFAQAMCITNGALDYLMEGQNAYHPTDTWGRYMDQKKEADVEAAKFQRTRVPKWLHVFEKQLSFNGDGKGFFLDDKLTFADIAVWHVCRATRNLFPEAWAAAEAPNLKAFMERIAALPRIAAYLASDRPLPFEDNSLM